MNRPEVGDAFVATAIPNPESRWASRITCVEVAENGIRFRREHPYHNGEVFFLTNQALEASGWRPHTHVESYDI